MGKSIAQLQREVARLQEELSGRQRRAKGKTRASHERHRLAGVKHGLSRELHPRRTKFSDFVKAQFRKHPKINFKAAVRDAKKAYREAKRGKIKFGEF